MTVLGGATTIAPVRMASISLDLNVSVEGAHAMSTGKMLHIRIVQKSTDMGHVVLLWTGMSTYDDLSGHGLEAHSRWVGSSGCSAV